MLWLNDQEAGQGFQNTKWLAVLNFVNSIMQVHLLKSM